MSATEVSNRVSSLSNVTLDYATIDNGNQAYGNESDLSFTPANISFPLPLWFKDYFVQDKTKGESDLLPEASFIDAIASKRSGVKKSPLLSPVQKIYSRKSQKKKKASYFSQFRLKRKRGDQPNAIAMRFHQPRKRKKKKNHPNLMISNKFLKSKGEQTQNPRSNPYRFNARRRVDLQRRKSNKVTVSGDKNRRTLNVFTSDLPILLYLTEDEFLYQIRYWFRRTIWFLAFTSAWTQNISLAGVTLALALAFELTLFIFYNRQINYGGGPSVSSGYGTSVKGYSSSLSEETGAYQVPSLSSSYDDSRLDPIYDDYFYVYEDDFLEDYEYDSNSAKHRSSDSIKRKRKKHRYPPKNKRAKYKKNRIQNLSRIDEMSSSNLLLDWRFLLGLPPHFMEFSTPTREELKNYAITFLRKNVPLAKSILK